MKFIMFILRSILWMAAIIVAGFIWGIILMIIPSREYRGR